MNNFIPAWIMIIVGFIDSVPPELQTISLVLGSIWAIVGMFIAIRKESRESKKKENKATII